MRPIKNTSKPFWNVGDKIIYIVDGEEEGKDIMTIIKKYPCPGPERKNCVKRQNGECSGNWFVTESESGMGQHTWHDIRDDFRRYYETD